MAREKKLSMIRDPEKLLALHAIIFAACYGLILGAPVLYPDYSTEFMALGFGTLVLTLVFDLYQLYRSRKELKKMEDEMVVRVFE